MKDELFPGGRATPARRSDQGTPMPGPAPEAGPARALSGPRDAHLEQKAAPARWRRPPPSRPAANHPEPGKSPQRRHRGDDHRQRRVRRQKGVLTGRGGHAHHPVPRRRPFRVYGPPADTLHHRRTTTAGHGGRRLAVAADRGHSCRHGRGGRTVAALGGGGRGAVHQEQAGQDRADHQQPDDTTPADAPAAHHSPASARSGSRPADGTSRCEDTPPRYRAAAVPGTGAPPGRNSPSCP